MITPFLWFNDSAEAAAKFYVEVFPDTEIVATEYYDKVGKNSGAKVMTVRVRIGEATYTLFNGGPHYALTPAFSLLVNCENQEQLDRIWDAVAQEGTAMQCGWITDKFGLTWQIVPKELFSLMSLPDPEAAQRVMSALFDMIKIDLATLQAAAAAS